jgi:hypothetical protein
MDCCSPDVGDCKKCHPELWKILKGVQISILYPLETMSRKKTLKRKMDLVKSKRRNTRRAR